MVAECAYQLRRRALGPPFRIPLAEPAVDETAQPAAHKKRKQRQRGWRPSEGDYFERPARVVGCSLVQPPLGQRNTGGTKEIVFVAIDEHGELVDRLRCRYLLTNIRVRGGPRGEMGEVGESRCSALDVERKLGELSRLETFFHEVGCEAIAVGACDLICRRIQVPSLYLPCTFPVPSPYLPCTFPVPSLYLPCTLSDLPPHPERAGTHLLRDGDPQDPGRRQRGRGAAQACGDVRERVLPLRPPLPRRPSRGPGALDAAGRGRAPRALQGGLRRGDAAFALGLVRRRTHRDARALERRARCARPGARAAGPARRDVPHTLAGVELPF